MDTTNYQNKICIVTGSSEGIGLETVKILLNNKAIVYGLDKINTPLSGLNYIECDLANKKSIDEAFKKIPDHIDCFFGNAAVSGVHDSFLNTYKINFMSNKYITEEYLINRMKAGGSIVFVSSFLGNHWDKYSSEFKEIINTKSWDKIEEIIKGQYSNDYGIKAYTLAKRSLNYFAAIKSLELGRLGIRVNTVIPGTTNTALLNDFKNSEGLLNPMIKQTGVSERIAHPIEIAHTLIFLNSDLATYINGVFLPVDNGNNTEIIMGYKTDKFDMKINSSLFDFGTDKIFSNKEKNNEIEII